MPTYEYSCEKCGKNFELFQSMKDEALKTCPKDSCQMKTWGKGRVKRLLGTGAGLIFKGSGFYITDYRSESYQKAAKAAEKPASAGGDAAKPASSPSPSSGSDKKTSAKPKKSSGET